MNWRQRASTAITAPTMASAATTMTSMSTGDRATGSVCDATVANSATTGWSTTIGRLDRCPDSIDTPRSSLEAPGGTTGAGSGQAADEGTEPRTGWTGGANDGGAGGANSAAAGGANPVGTTGGANEAGTVGVARDLAAKDHGDVEVHARSAQ